MKTKIIIGFIAVAFLYFSDLYLLPFNLWYYTECKGIVTKVEKVPGHLGSEAKVSYEFNLSNSEMYKNISYEFLSDSIRKGDTIIIHYISFYPKENWLFRKQNLK